MSKFFYDCEFLEGKQKEKFPMSLFRKETKPTIDLISIGIVSEDGGEYYAISKEFNLKEAWNRYDLVPDMLHGGTVKVFWIRENVLKSIWMELYSKEHRFGNVNNLLGFIEYEDISIDDIFTYKSLNSLIKKYGKYNSEIAVGIKEFTNVIARDKFDASYITGEKVELYGYYSAYDHVCMCWIFGKMMDLPSGFPMFTYDLKQEVDNYIAKTWKDVEMSTWGHEGITLEKLKTHPDYPKQYNAHNALDDAMFNKNLYDFLKKL